MHQQEEFEILKEKVLKSYADYMDVIRKASFDDLDSFKTRKHLVDTFTRSVANNASYRDFINGYKK